MSDLQREQELLEFQHKKRMEDRQVAWFNATGETYASYGMTHTNYMNPYDDNFVYSGISEDNIKKALDNVAKGNSLSDESIKTIRQFSRYLYLSDDAYGMAINDFVGSVLWIDNVIPLFDASENKDNYFKNKKVVQNHLTMFNKDAMYQVFLSLLVNGLYIGYENEKILQPLPLDYCKILGKVNGFYEIAFDISYFSSQHAELINYYPTTFKDMYDVYLADNKKRWHTLKWNKTYVFTTPMFIPLLTRSFKNILLKYKSDAFLEEGLGSEQIKFIIQKIPMDKDSGDILADASVVNKFHSAIVKQMPKNVVVITSPFDTKPEAYTENKMSTTSDKRNYINEQVYKSVGLSESTLGIAKAQSGYKIYVRALESKLNLLLPQFGDRISYFINNIQHKEINKTLNWKFTYLPITTQNREEWYTNVKELQKEGGLIGLPYQIATGLSLDDIKSMLTVEKVEDFKSYLHQEEKSDGEYNPKGGKKATTDDGESSKDRELGDEM